MAIKEFFKSVSTSVKNATNKAVDKIDDTLDVQKLKYRIAKKEEEIKEIYRTLGEQVVRAVYAEEDFDECIASAIAKLDELREELALMNAERIEKENKVICSGCGVEISKKYDFCPKCGAALKAPEDDTACACDDTAEDTVSE